MAHDRGVAEQEEGLCDQGEERRQSEAQDLMVVPPCPGFPKIFTQWISTALLWIRDPPAGRVDKATSGPPGYRQVNQRLPK
jgi:hypothetical protein